jgi:hypothetical protein
MGRSKKWHRYNRGSRDRNMAQYEIGKPQPSGVGPFHQGGTYRAYADLTGGRAAARNMAFGRPAKGNRKRAG